MLQISLRGNNCLAVTTMKTFLMNRNRFMSKLYSFCTQQVYKNPGNPHKHWVPGDVLFIPTRLSS